MRRHREAFTLVELLVVIAIIAILIAMVFNLANRAITKANQTKSLNNMRQVATGFMMYAADNNGRLPNRPADNNGQDRWPKLIYDGYLKDKRIYAAMDDPSNFIKRNTDPLSNSTNNTSYIMNGTLDPGRSEEAAEAYPISLASIEQPSKTILLGLLYDDGNFFLDVANKDQRLIKPYQFGTSNNYVFMDGSARTIDGKEYLELNSQSSTNAWLWLIHKEDDPAAP